jgi:hypothetical protein
VIHTTRIFKDIRKCICYENGEAPDVENKEVNNEMEELIITPEHVQKVLNKLKEGKSPGPNGLKPVLLKKRQ